jgi:Ribbon-helix-helix protein, copG family
MSVLCVSVLDLCAYIAYNLAMKRIALFLSVPQYEALAALAKKLGLSFSEVVRRALDHYLKQQP